MVGALCEMDPADDKLAQKMASNQVKFYTYSLSLDIFEVL